MQGFTGTKKQEVGQGLISWWNIIPFPTPVYSVDWQNPLSTSYWGLTLWSMITPTKDTGFEFEAYLGTGTYTLTYLYTQGASQGIWDWYMEGALLGAVDHYGSVVYNKLKTFTGIVVSTPGLKRIRVWSNTKNASATNYALILNGLVLWRTT